MTSVKQSYQGSTAKLLLLAAALFVAATNAFVIAGLLPDIAHTLGATPAQVSYSITSYSLVVAVTAPLVSILLARVPRAMLMTSGLAVFALGTAIATAGDSLTLFLAGRTLSGLGSAALVPTATAAAAALSTPERRGRALAIVGAGFTLATAVGSPLGTALGGVAGWRLPMWLLVGLAAVLVVVLPVVVRGVPLSRPVSVRRRMAPLSDRRILAPLGTTLMMVAGFNIVYIFSSTVTAAATHGSGALLAVLLFSYGVAGVVGNLAAGPASDRFGSRPTAVLMLAGQVAVLAVLTIVEASFAASVIVFATWGFVTFATVIPLQHRLVHVDPESAAVTLSWYSTAMYVGIAVAPPLATAAIAIGGARGLPVAGSLATLVAMVLFLAGYTRRRTVREPEHAAPSGVPPCDPQAVATGSP